MNQCVPSWENNGISATQRLSRRRTAQFNSNLFIPHVPSMNVLDDGHEMAAAAAAELMWEKGELLLQDIAATGKTMPILFPSPPENNMRYEFEKPRAGGTLESVVNQGTRPVPVPVPVPDVLHKIMGKDPMVENLFPWFYGHGGGPAANLTAMDALVPCSAGDQAPDSGKVHAGMFTDGYSAGVGSCSGKHDDDRKGTKRRRNETRLESSAARVPSSEWSDPYEWESEQISLDTTTTTSETERETGTWGFTSTSMTSGSPENTCTYEYDSPCQSRRPQVELKRSRLEYSKKSSISTQRSMTAFSTTYNQSEQRRRRIRRRGGDRMEERMVTLQKMVPNSNKVDKVAVLDEVIEHLKQLQSQVDMLNRMNMVAPPMHQHQQHQHLQLQMMLNMMTMMSAAAAPTGFMGMGGIGMGVGVGLDPNAFTRYSSSVPTRNGPPAFMNGVPPSPVDFINMTASPFLMHTDPISMFLANYQSQQQLTTMDGYGTMADFFNQPQLPQL